MTQDFLKYYKSNVLIFLIGILLFAVFMAKDHWNLSISIFGIVSTILILISKYLWKYRPFIWLFNIDDFSGRYEGILKYQYHDKFNTLKTGELKHVKLINQNGSRITISSFSIQPDDTRSSISVSKGMHIEKTADEQHYHLIYNYLNEGRTNQDFPPHYGTETIKFIKNGSIKMLTGGYYTNRIPHQTKGEFIELKWVSNDLNHDY